MSSNLQRQVSGVVAAGLVCLAVVLLVPAWLVHTTDREQIAALRGDLLRAQWLDVMEIASERLKAASESGERDQLLYQRVSDQGSTDISDGSASAAWLPHNRLRRAQINGHMSSWLVAPDASRSALLVATAFERADGSFAVVASPAAFLQGVTGKMLGHPWRIVGSSGAVILGDSQPFEKLPQSVFARPDQASTDVVRIEGESFHPIAITLQDINGEDLAWLQALRPVESGTLKLRAWIAAAGVLVLLIGAAFAVWLASAIRRTSAPLAHLARAIRGLAAGDAFVSIPSGHRQAEVDNIASAVEVFREHALKLDQLQFEANLARLNERNLLAAQLARLAGVLDEQARQRLEHDLVEQAARPDASDSGVQVEGALPRALRHMTDRIITQQSHLSAVLAERTADLEIVRQALAERMQLNRLREEIAIARDLQLTYLPDVSEAQSLLPGIDLHALMRPAKEVGGDVYDFRRLDEQRLMLIIGDASGKGIPAAMYILMCRILLQTAVGILGSTAQALRVANDALSRDNDAMVFTTAFVAILNLPTGELTYTNAGHNKPLIRRANGQVEALSGAHGVLMGVAEGFDYQEAKAFISPGDTLLLYTDGVTEAHAPDDNLFGENRLISSLTEAAAGNAAETVQALIEAVDAFSAGREQSDDITLTVLRRPLAT